MSKKSVIKPNEDFLNEVPSYILNRPLEQPLEILDREVVGTKEEHFKGKLESKIDNHFTMANIMKPIYDFSSGTIVDNKTIILDDK